jgi:hypothetical protein
MKTALTIAAAFVGVTTAANADGYRPATKFEQVKATCELIADGLQPSPGFVVGPPEWVAGHNFGAAIGGLVKHAQNYDNCMVLHGYAKVQ